MIAIANLVHVQGVLERRWARKLGDLSYAIYLFHWTIITLVMPYTERIPIQSDEWKRIFILFMDTLLILLISELFMKFIYTPFSNLLYRLSKRNALDTK